MSRKISIILGLMCACLFSMNLNAAVLSVGSGQTYATIGDAYAAAVTGDTIEIHEGLYYAESSWNVGVAGKNNITFQRFENDKVVVGGLTVNSGVTGYVFDGLIFVASGLDSQVLVNASDTTWKNNIFYSNLQATKGTGMQIGYAAHRQVIENCTFLGENGWGIWADGIAHTITIKDSLFVSNNGTATRFGSGGASMANVAAAVEYSGFWDNANDVGGLVTIGTGSVTGVEIAFASTDIDDANFGYLAAGTSDLIALGDSDGSYMGARGVVPEPATMSLLALVGLTGVLRRK